MSRDARVLRRDQSENGGLRRGFVLHAEVIDRLEDSVLQRKLAILEDLIIKIIDQCYFHIVLHYKIVPDSIYNFPKL